MNLNLIKIAAAQVGTFPDRLVPECDPTGQSTTTPACNMDKLLELGTNVVYALIAIGFLVTILFVIIGGFRLVVSQGNPERLQAARANITSAIVGLVIVLVSWVVLGSLLNMFVDKDRCSTLEWYRFQGLQCEQQFQPSE